MNTQQEVDFAEALGKKIHKLRKEHDLTLRGLGRLIDMTGANIGIVEKGRSIPSSFMLMKLSKVFGVSVEYLLNVDIPVTESVNVENDIVMDNEEFKEYLELAKKAYFKGISAKDLNSAIRILNIKNGE